MTQQITHDNHYVPIWYQKQFLNGPKKSYYYLNLDVKQQVLANGKLTTRQNISTPPSPKSCFNALDLYTTQFGDELNDEIERVLFGEIDDKGALAVRALISNDSSNIHKFFQSFFIYLDAQKLRTPKGLDWIKSKYPGLTQVELMEEMQGLRLMHCGMWAEGVREIVSAENSEVKFIVTDHPVTVYNAACPPTAAVCSYPNDPPIELQGTQTIFVLDANHCLILTNLEYAQNPVSTDLTKPRTNARYRGNSLVHTDAFIRSRKLISEEVIVINNILKTRARQYIAAGEREWLFPEKACIGSWDSFAAVLLPKNEHSRFGGEMYVGFKDGSSSYQDEFGRNSKAYKYLQKKSRSTIQRNDLCGCGSGHKFKRCCSGIPEEIRPSWSVFSIRERNLMFCRAIAKILGIDSGKDWEDVRKELSEDQVKKIYEVFESLWPRETDITELLPRSDEKHLRAVYLGVLDHRTIMANVTSMLLYFDEIIAPHPFINPTYIKPEFNPISSPEEHKEQTLKNLFLLLILEPYIEAGIIHLVPDPADFNDEFRKDVWGMAKDRTGECQFKDEDMGHLLQLKKDDFLSAIRKLPIDSLRRYLLRHSDGSSIKQVESVVEYLKNEHEMDPCSLLQPVKPGSSQFHFMKGFNLELSMFLAKFSGAVIYTDIPLHWKHLHEHTKVASAPSNLWNRLSDRLKSVEFILECDYQKSLFHRMDGKFSVTRGLFRRIGNAARTGNENKIIDAAVNELTRDVDKVEVKMQKEWQATVLKHSPKNQIQAKIEVSIPLGGFEMNTVRRLLLTFGRASHVRAIPMALLVKYDN